MFVKLYDGTHIFYNLNYLDLEFFLSLEYIYYLVTERKKMMYVPQWSMLQIEYLCRPPPFIC